ncbi:MULTISPECIES: acyl carrier protein [Streptomyces]|jgi:acyl carrier protein|uniref:Acyl carrier protein n=1 Tax=Streptomyces ortus TaxID=2867268 RepID=A0ABT3VD83_9ACTN|nr:MULTISPECIES: acyl carrier protein [Streptomyces]MCX4237648.1 acyl carrier protein [Streptomyces ortus]
MNLRHEITHHIVSTYLPDTPAADLEPSLDLFDTGVVNSLQLLELIGWLRERYRLPVEDLDLSLQSFRSVAAIQDFIETNTPTSATRATSATGTTGGETP